MNERSRKLLLFGAEVALVVGYLIVFVVFVAGSENFIVARDNRQATTAASAIAPEIPATWSFGPEEPDNVLLGAGWHGPFDTDVGVWTRSHAAYVIVPVPTSTAALRIQLAGEPFLTAGHETVSITLWLDGAEAGRWTAQFGQPAPRVEAVVPLAATADGLVELRLEAIPLAVPYHYDRSADKRNVGYRLRAITVTQSSARISYSHGQNLPVTKVRPVAGS